MTLDHVEPNGELPRPDEAEHAVVMLAMAVLAQAFRDLNVQSGIHDVHRCRHDAYEFLTVRLWDPECLWGNILGPYLIQRKVLEVVQRHLVNPRGFTRPWA